MASLPLSSLPSGSLHLDAFRGLNYSLGRGLGDNEFILTTIRRYGEHEVEDRINIWILSRRNGGVYVSASCAGTQCCPCAPQGDIQYLLFKNGDWLKGDNERILISQSDEPCGGGQETGALTESASSHSVAPACEIDPTSDHSTKTIRPTQLMSHKRPTEGDSVVMAKILSGLTSILLGELDYSNAIITAWKGNEETSSLLDLWDRAAVSNTDVTSVIMLTEKRTMKSRGEAEYLHWLGKIMTGCLVFAQTEGKLLPENFREENKFIKWTRRLPKLLRLLQPAGITGLLVLKAFGNSSYSFTELDRQSESSLENFIETEWAKIRLTLSYIHHRLRGHSILKKKVSIFNPIALCCRYLQKQRKDINYRKMCQIFGASDWVESEVFELKTIRELLPPQVLVTGSIRRQIQLRACSTKEGKKLVAVLDKLVPDEEPQSAAERQTPPSQQGTTSCGPSYSRPRFDPVRDTASPCHSEGAASGQRTTAGPLSRQSHADLQLSPVAFDQFALEDPTAQTELFADRLSPRRSSYQAYPSSQAPSQPQPAGVVQNLPREAISLSFADPAPSASVQRNIMPDASALDQMLSCRAVRDPNALASAASQPFPLHFDGDSGYGGSTVSSQFLMATSAMPVPFGDSETADPCSRSDSLRGPERPNNVPARPIEEQRMALADEAPPPAALASGSHSYLTVGEALVPYGPTVQNPAYDAIVPNEDSLFLLSQPSIDSGYATNKGGQQVRGTTTSLAPSSGPFLLDTEGRGEWAHAAAGQKRPQVGENAASKRHRPSAEETTENLNASEALNADPAARSPCNADGGVMAFQSNGAAPTNISTDPQQNKSFPGLAEVEHTSDFSVGSGMDLMDFWTGSGMDLQNVNLASPTGFPVSLGEEQPCESSPPAAGSENERQAE